MIIRPATAADAPDMVTLLNAIIEAGGTTAHQTLFDETTMLEHYIESDGLISCLVAEIEEVVLGFQWLRWAKPEQDGVPDDWAIIASFVANRAAGKGVGQHLFKATRTAASQAGVAAIDATIRADNTPGLRYYSGLGFVDYDRLTGLALSDGTIVDRIRKRFDISVSS
ncbi:GNAT family N-acetyltransferase [Yoonia sp. BS5-3]|uniref:N-acetyltransferase family protein n=1 Tax=Yoonia phaeophyticola TaxID=3137369 RepID=A0ABZ2V4V8_9RHOB